MNFLSDESFPKGISYYSYYIFFFLILTNLLKGLPKDALRKMGIDLAGMVYIYNSI